MCNNTLIIKIFTLVFGFGGGVGSEFCNIGNSSLATIPGFDSSS